MTNNNKPLTKTNIFSQQPNTFKNKPSLKSVRQDKYASQRVRTASRQPVTLKTMMRTRRLNKKNPRSQKRHVDKNESVKLMLWLNPIVKAEIQRIALAQGLSFAETAATFLEKAMQEKIDRQRLEFLRPVIEDIVRQKMQGTHGLIEALEQWIMPRKSLREKN